MEMLHKEVKHESSLFAICFQTLGQGTSGEIELDMRQLLQKFGNVFREPNQ